MTLGSRAAGRYTYTSISSKYSTVSCPQIISIVNLNPSVDYEDIIYAAQQSTMNRGLLEMKLYKKSVYPVRAHDVILHNAVAVPSGQEV